MYPQEDPSIQNPIHKVLSTLTTHPVRALLMGGQACVLYGAAEFSRDTDLAFQASGENLELLRVLLRHLHARRIAVPPFDLKYLRRGHAIHFRCYHPDAYRIRIDVMSLMRGVDAFDELWQRRQTVVLPDGTNVELLSLADLVHSKKTQRDKDWPMIRRLIEADYVSHPVPSPQKIRFWLSESRTPGMLIDLAQRFPADTKLLAHARPLLLHALSRDAALTEEALDVEQKLERQADRQYWLPLFEELEELRRLGFESEEEV